MPRWGIYDSDSDDKFPSSSKSHGRQRSLHAIFGGGLVADILLWRNKHLSGGILIVFTIIWFLFEVVEYHFISLLCHLLMFFMAILFIWSNSSGLIKRDPPSVNDLELQESMLRFFLSQINNCISNLHYVSSGKDLITFFATIGCLWILAACGSLCSTLNFLYVVYLCMATLPALYERYEDQVDRFAGKSSHEVKNLFEKFNSKVLDKIPRGPRKDKKLT
ncbi:reticulon-like protein B14 isoform X2 [Jatropha curcas]|uniref:reticulon-like protein B14 isoform X2 n=1 Tax=Jatropha curcas TaxID=180498 RepID=UPI0005FB0BF8|nr:reticulon-like protein B14 isoform X2 [Jatropha curcas]